MSSIERIYRIARHPSDESEDKDTPSIRFQAEGTPICDNFYLEFGTWNALNKPSVIEIVVRDIVRDFG